MGLKPFQREILGLLLLALGVLTFLALLSATSGALSRWWARLLRLLFGWGAYPVALGLGALGLFLLLGNLELGPEVRWETVVGLEAALLAVLGLLHLLAFSEDPLRLAEKGGGGGYIGWAISSLLIGALGWPIALVLLLAAAGLGLAVAFRISWADVRRAWASLAAAAHSLYRHRLAPPAPSPVGERKKKAVVKPPAKKAGPAPSPPRIRAMPEEKPKPRARARRRGLPPLDLLDRASPVAFSEAEARRRAEIIEETLASFGVPVRVVEINQGPVVTQFGVEPGYIEKVSSDGHIRRRKVRVSQISALASDLALALAAAPIRIEAPVPGKSVVGIEVPNTEISLVSLREVMESPQFRRRRSRLKIALGQGVAGQPVVADLATMPHLLIAGATGSGKSVCINSIVTCLVFNNTPEDLRLVMIDPKMVELTKFNGLPHLIGRVETDVERIIGVLRWVTREMDERYKKLAQAGARNLDDYNRKVGSDERLPYIVVAIDELADLMLAAPDEVERLICRIAQMARATGIHLILATQRPSVDVVTGLIKANFPARISFAVTSQVDSRVILDSAGAEALLGAGDMLYMAPDSSKLVRLRGCFVSDEEIKRVVQFWRERAAPEPLAEEVVPWEEMEGAEEDELLREAIELVKRHRRASASFLQRRLRIGYPRAARLLDQLEERGIVGPAEGGGRSREVLIGPNEFEEAEESVPVRRREERGQEG